MYYRLPCMRFVLFRVDNLDNENVCACQQIRGKIICNCHHIAMLFSTSVNREQEARRRDCLSTPSVQL